MTLTGPSDTWNKRHGVACRGCQLGEFWGIPRHEPSCPVATTWYALPEDTPAWVRALADAHDLGPVSASPACYEDRQTLWGLHWLTRAAWHAWMRRIA